MKNTKVEERIIYALRQQEPQSPIKHELGGGYYYQCHWIACGETVTKFMEYCPKCGQRIDWSEE